MATDWHAVCQLFVCAVRQRPECRVTLCYGPVDGHSSASGTPHTRWGRNPLGSTVLSGVYAGSGRSRLARLFSSLSRRSQVRPSSQEMSPIVKFSPSARKPSVNVNARMIAASPCRHARAPESVHSRESLTSPARRVMDAWT